MNWNWTYCKLYFYIFLQVKTFFAFDLSWAWDDHRVSPVTRFAQAGNRIIVKNGTVVYTIDLFTQK